MMSNTNVNTKYKTSMCRHWEQTGNCQLGPKCHFAHGKDDLRSMSDPLPMNAPPRPQNLQQKTFQKPMMSDNNFTNDNMNGGGSTPSNYKTALCKYFEKGSCKYETKCNFAHGDQDLRQSKPRPMGGQMGGGMGGGGMGRGGGGGMNPLINRGMMMSNQTPTYQQMGSPYQQMGSPYQQMSSPYQQMGSPYQQMSSPYQQMSSPMMQQSGPSPSMNSDNSNQLALMQLTFLIQQVMKYHADDEEILAKVQLANEQVQQNNVSGAAELLNKIIQRSDKSQEDNENYGIFISNIQQMATTYSSPYQSQQMGGGPSGGMMGMNGPSGYNTGGYSPMQQSPTQTYNPNMSQQGGPMLQSRR